jgi:hypothetical protein
MAGRAAAVAGGDALCKAVVTLAEPLGLQARAQYRCGRRIWGAERLIDVVLTHPRKPSEEIFGAQFQRPLQR